MALFPGLSSAHSYHATVGGRLSICPCNFNAAHAGGSVREGCFLPFYVLPGRDKGQGAFNCVRQFILQVFKEPVGAITWTHRPGPFVCLDQILPQGN